MRNILNKISRRSSIGIFLFALLTAMIFSARVQKAWAYFTTYATAKGGRTVELGDTTTTSEGYVGYRKVINISNSEDSNPVWVRVRVIAGPGYEEFLDCSERDEDWSKADDEGWYYFKNPLGPGESTGQFNSSQEYNGFVVNVKNLLEQEFEEGTRINVDVVYETVPVRYNADGSAEEWSDADWSGEVDVTTVNADD